MTLPLSMLQFSRSMSSSLYVKPQDNFRPVRQKNKTKNKTKQNKRDCSTLRCNLFVNERIAWLSWHTPQGTAAIFFFQTKSTNKSNEEPLDRKTCLGVQHTSSQTVNCWLFPCDLSIDFVQISVSLWRRLFLQTLRPSERLEIFSFSWLTGTEDKKGNLIWVSGLKVNLETLSGETFLNI